MLLVVLFSAASACRKSEVNKTAEMSPKPKAPRGSVMPAIDPRSSHPPTPQGALYLLERVSVTTDSGVIGINPGARLRLVSAKDDMLRVKEEGGTSFDVSREKVTEDVYLGRLASRADLASQQAIADYLQDQHDAEKAANDTDTKWRDEQDHRVAERRKLEAESRAHRFNPLDREAYNQTYSYPYWYPYGYPYRYSIRIDRYGYHYWVDRWGSWHYVP